MKPALVLPLVLAGALVAGAQLRPAPPAVAPLPPTALPPMQVAPLAPAAVFAQDMVYFGGNSWLGVSLADLNDASAKQLHLASVNGAQVKDVFPDSPAAKAGIEPGDVIVSFHGAPVISVRELTRMINDEPPHRTVAVGLMRAGRPLTVEVRIGNRRYRNESWPEVNVRIPPIPPMHVVIPPIPAIDTNAFSFRLLGTGGAALGVAVEEIPSQLAHYFGVVADHAVLVRSVASGGIGDTAGLRAGDVIVNVAGTPVATVDQFYDALGRHQTAKFSLQVLRKGRPATVEIPALAPRMQGAASENWPEEAQLAADLDRARAEVGRVDSAQIHRALAQAHAQIAAERPQIEAAARLARSQWRKSLEVQMRVLQQRMRELQKQLQRDQQSR